MSLQALLVSRDLEALSVLQEVMHELEVRTVMYPELRPAAEHLAEAGPSVVVADYDVEHASGLLKLVRQNYAGSCVALALVKNLSSLQTAHDLGANFVLIKPVSAEAARHSLAEAVELIQRMAGRLPRLVIPTLAYVNFENVPDPAIMLDISEGGMAVQALQPLAASGPVRVQFDLPGWFETIDVSCQVVWADSTGRAGLRFTDLSEDARHHLQEWLRVNRAMAEISVPGEKAPPKLFSASASQPVVTPYAGQPTPSVAHRIFSAVVDGTIVLLASAVWMLIFWLWARHLPSSRWTLPAALVVPFLLSAIYLYLFLVHPYGTPGMQMAEKGSRAANEHGMFSFAPQPRLVVASVRMLSWLQARTRRQIHSAPQEEPDPLPLPSVTPPTEEPRPTKLSIQV